MNDQETKKEFSNKRVLKFRAWHNVQKEMLSDIHDGMMIQMNSGEVGTYDEDWHVEDVVLMQFTGLYDKNKKPIYEGDIVQRGVILFANGKFQGFYYESNGGIAESWEDDLCQEKNIEVLGNMYENPELMLE